MEDNELTIEHIREAMKLIPPPIFKLDDKSVEELWGD